MTGWSNPWSESGLRFGKLSFPNEETPPHQTLQGQVPCARPEQKLDWQNKHIYAFAAKSNFEAAWFFEKLVDHSLASEGGHDRTYAVFIELGRLRMVAQQGFGDRRVDTDLALGFVYTRYIQPMTKRYGIQSDNREGYDLHAPKKKFIHVPNLDQVMHVKGRVSPTHG